MGPDTERHLHARLARAQADGRLPSLAAGVVAGGAPAWSAARGRVAGGPADVDAQYRIGSITKTLTAVLVLRLRDEGLLRLDDAVEQHLPGLPLHGRTVGQLLSHGSGLRAEPAGEWWERVDGPDWAAVEATVGDDDLLFGAGRRFHYSNVGYGALGAIVARLRGRSWEDCLTDEVLAPLGMRRTTAQPAAPYARGYAVHPFADLLLDEPLTSLGGMSAAGQLWSTVSDLSRLITFLLGDTGDVLARDTLLEMLQPGPLDDIRGVWSAYGLGVQVHRVDDRTLVGHGGSVPGFLALLLADPDERCGVVVLANSTAGLDPTLPTDLLATVREREPLVVSEWQPAAAVDPGVLALLGAWFWGPSMFVLRLRPDGDLEVAPAGVAGRGARFANVDGRWIGRTGYYAGEELRLVDDHLDIGTFVFTRTPYPVGEETPGGVPTGWRSATPEE